MAALDLLLAVALLVLGAVLGAVLGVLTGTPYHPYSWLLRICLGFLAGALAYLGVRRMRRTPRVHLVTYALAL